MHNLYVYLFFDSAIQKEVLNVARILNILIKFKYIFLKFNWKSNYQYMNKLHWNHSYRYFALLDEESFKNIAENGIIAAFELRAHSLIYFHSTY